MKSVYVVLFGLLILAVLLPTLFSEGERVARTVAAVSLAVFTIAVVLLAVMAG